MKPFSEIYIANGSAPGMNIDVLRNIYLPALSNCKKHQRMTFSFNSASLVELAIGIEDLILNKGTIDLIIGETLQPAEDKSIEIGEKAISKGHSAICLARLKILLDEKYVIDSDYEYKLGLLTNLIGAKKLKIKFAVKENRLTEVSDISKQHSKTAIFHGLNEEKVVWGGSGNLSRSGMIDNLEEISVYKSWIPESGYNIHATRLLDSWELLWENKVEEWKVAEVPSKFYKEWTKRFPKTKKKNFRTNIPGETNIKDIKKAKPQFSENDLRDYQLDVLKDWEKAERKGLVKHATGSGKTFTALFALKRHLQKHQVALILVPSLLLQEQWKEELLKIMPQAREFITLVSSEYTTWRGNIRSLSRPPKDGKPRIIIAVSNSACKKEFIRDLIQGDHLMLIADEVHRLGSKHFSKVFEIESGPRLGLSATPERFGDPEGTDRILSYFGKVLPTEFNIQDAIKRKALVPYQYYPKKVYLSDDESSYWEEISYQISRAASKCKRNEKGKIIPSKYLEILLFTRAKIAKEAQAKINLACEVLKENYMPDESWLVYCQSEIQLEELYEKLIDSEISPYKYHSLMTTKQRSTTLNLFKNTGGVILSMKCLDEGVDIPSASHALILSSDQNPRQFIQRRGRVLRRDPENTDKKRAFIYDLVISASINQKDQINDLVETELFRALEFSDYAENKDGASANLREIAMECGLDLNNLETKLEQIEDEEEGEVT